MVKILYFLKSVIECYLNFCSQYNVHFPQYKNQIKTVLRAQKDFKLSLVSNIRITPTRACHVTPSVQIKTNPL